MDQWPERIGIHFGEVPRLWGQHPEGAPPLDAETPVSTANARWAPDSSAWIIDAEGLAALGSADEIALTFSGPVLKGEGRLELMDADDKYLAVYRFGVRADWVGPYRFPIAGALPWRSRGDVDRMRVAISSASSPAAASFAAAPPALKLEFRAYKD